MNNLLSRYGGHAIIFNKGRPWEQFKYIVKENRTSVKFLL